MLLLKVIITLLLRSSFAEVEAVGKVISDNETYSVWNSR